MSGFACPLCPRGQGGGNFVFVGVPDNDRAVAYDNLPTMINKLRTKPANFPESWGVGVRRRVVRRHMEEFHQDQADSAEFEALTAIWQPHVQFNSAGGKAIAAKRKASSGGKPASSSARTIIPAKQDSKHPKCGAINEKRSPVCPCWKSGVRPLRVPYKQATPENL